MTTLGEKIRSARQSTGVSVELLAERIDVSPNTVYRWERDELTPPVERLEQIACVLGLTLALEFRDPTPVE